MTTNEKLKHVLWVILIFLFVISACQRSTSEPNETKTVPSKTNLPSYDRQRADFDFLIKGISYEEIVARIGKEDRDIGSGLYILEYNLADGSKVYLQFSSLESLDKAYIKSTDGHIENIIEP